jgi:membrane-associated phospholipid phosphatase
MKFNYVKEYFYKLSSLGYQLMMLPLILFIIYYTQSLILLPDLTLWSEQVSQIIFFVMSGISIIILTAVQIFTNIKANLIARENGLGIKLEKLERILNRKMKLLSVLILAMSLMLLFTGNSYFSMAFGVLTLWYFLQWPTPARVCRLLKLRGDEREMVITRGDAFI